MFHISVLTTSPEAAAAASVAEAITASPTSPPIVSGMVKEAAEASKVTEVPAGAVPVAEKLILDAVEATTQIKKATVTEAGEVKEVAEAETAADSELLVDKALNVGKPRSLTLDETSGKKFI